MMRIKLLVFSIASIAVIELLLCEAAIAKSSLPQAVINKISQLELDTLSSGKEQDVSTYKVQTDSTKIKQLDINSDGIVDYIIDDRDVKNLSGIASFRHGTHGSMELIIFAGKENGAAALAFDQVGYDYYIEQTNGIPVVWITVGGNYCDNNNSLSFSEMVFCDVPLIWNTFSKQFDLAAPSEARIPSKLKKF